MKYKCTRHNLEPESSLTLLLLFRLLCMCVVCEYVHVCVLSCDEREEKNHVKQNKQT